MSSVTERDRVYCWLDADDKSRPASAISPTTDTEFLADLLSTAKLSQTVGYLSLQVAAKLRSEARLREAYDTYRYALELFEDHPLGRYIFTYSFRLCYFSTQLNSTQV